MEESKSDLFLRTYNGNYLRGFNSEELEALEQRINDSPEFKQGEKTTLIRLMHRPAYSFPRLIYGPKHFYIARKNGMNIYLFGEKHLQTAREIYHNCAASRGGIYDPNFPKFVDVLKDIETKGKTFFDVFVEFHYIKQAERTTTPTNYIGLTSSYTFKSLIEKYGHCLTKTSRDNHCNNFRFHYSDIRNFNGILFGVLKDCQRIEDLLLFFSNKPLFKSVFRDFANYDSNPWVFHSYVLDNPILKKQLEKSYLKNHIKKYTSFIIGNYITPEILFAFKILDELLNGNIAHEVDLVLTMYSKIHTFFLYFESLLMDSYLLARLFKIYDRTKDIDYRGPDRTYNAIIYSGSTHTKNIKYFLHAALGFQIDEIYVPPNEGTSCVQISDVAVRGNIFNYRPVVSPSPFVDLENEFIYVENAFDYSQYLREEKIENPVLDKQGNELLSDLIYSSQPPKRRRF